MKESCGKERATHTDLESCAAARKGGGEALTEARAGRAIEPRNLTPGRRRRCQTRKATFGASQMREAPRSGAVEEPEHARKHSAREPGGPVFARRRKEQRRQCRTL